MKKESLFPVSRSDPDEHPTTSRSWKISLTLTILIKELVMHGTHISTWHMLAIVMVGPVVVLFLRFGISKSKREEVRDVLTLQKTSSPKVAYWIAVVLVVLSMLHLAVSIGDLFRYLTRLAHRGHHTVESSGSISSGSSGSEYQDLETGN